MNERHAFAKCKICGEYHAGVEHVWGGKESTSKGANATDAGHHSPAAVGRKSTAARMDVRTDGEGALSHSATDRAKRSGTGTQAPSVDTTPKRARGRPKGTTDRNEYQRDLMRKRRAKQKDPVQ